jgi:hypothetical protein
MITRQDVIDYLKAVPGETVLMSDVITAFKPRMAMDSRNHPIFLNHVKDLTVKSEAKTLKILREKF